MLENNIQALVQSKYNWFAENNGQEYPKFLAYDKEFETSFFENIDGQIAAAKDQYEILEELNPNKKQAIFIIGIYSLNEIKNIIRKKHKESIIIIIEPNMGFFEFTLKNKDLTFLNDSKICIFADNEINNLQIFLHEITRNLNNLGLFKNAIVYFTYYYRNYDIHLMHSLMKKIKLNLRLLSLNIGNAALDSLQGLENNMNNLNYLMKSKNPAKLKNKLKNCPAVIVAAGPSLQKNMHYLKTYQGKIVIVAVDTILKKLVKEGIVPDFVCSVERLPEVYDYFYKDQEFPKKTTLVGPLLLDTRIFENYPNEVIIPFRTEVHEYVWLQQMLEIKEDVSMPVGLSCAHMAFGVAQHLGCSPIILIGQDLSYDAKTGSSHVDGTYYDENSISIQENSTDELIDGYYGEKVKSTKVWMSFKKWFEVKITEKNLNVINATEGGAKIFNTIQMPLKETLEKYAIKNGVDVSQLIDETPRYDIDMNKVISNLQKENVLLQAIQNTFKEYFIDLSKIAIVPGISQKEKLRINTKLEEIHDMIKMIAADKLLLHNSQALLAEFMWNYQDIEDIISVENLLKKLGCVGRLVASVATVIEHMKEYIDKGINTERV